MAKALLTREENALWERVFSDEMNHGATERQADREAWRQVQKQFPRLRAFSGAKSGTRNPGGFRQEAIDTAPTGWRVRTVTRGAHRVRIACAPGKGAGCKVIAILHPKNEANPCGYRYVMGNPSELLIMGMNPTRARPNPHTVGSRISDMRDRGASGKEVGRMLSRLSNPSGKGKREKGKGERRNPESAEGMYQTFHGRGHKEILALQTPEPSLRLASLGSLAELTIKPVTGRKWVNLDYRGEGVKLATNAAGTQIFFVGGKQTPGPLDDFGTDASKEIVELGEGLKIVYRAKKSFTDFQPTDWEHEFGEEGGARPIVGFDKARQQLFLLGGDYRVEAPGIIN